MLRIFSFFLKLFQCVKHPCNSINMLWGNINYLSSNIIIIINKWASTGGLAERWSIHPMNDSINSYIWGNIYHTMYLVECTFVNWSLNCFQNINVMRIRKICQFMFKISNFRQICKISPIPMGLPVSVCVCVVCVCVYMCVCVAHRSYLSEHQNCK